MDTNIQIADDYFAELDAQAAAEKEANLLKHSKHGDLKLAAVAKGDAKTATKSSAEKHQEHIKRVHAGKTRVLLCLFLSFSVQHYAHTHFGHGPYLCRLEQGSCARQVT